MGTRAVIYTRVSKDASGQARSVGEQEAECRRTADREGWHVVRTFCDNDRSASRYATKKRPEYAALIDLLRSGGADVLVTWEASRAQRDLEVYVQLRDLCAQHEVLWSYSGRTHDLSRTDDRFTTGLDALLAERESSQTRDRILRTVRANAGKGRPHGRLLYGYQREYDPTSGVLLRQVIRDDQADVVREAASRVLAGETPYAIAQDYNARGIVSPGRARWDLTEIRRLLTNPGYAAKRVHRGQVIGDADWPAVLDAATFARLQAKFSDPSRKTLRDTSVKHLLSMIARCGVCGAAVVVQKNRSSLAYLCREGFHVSRKEADVDRYVLSVILGRLAMPDAAAFLAAGADDDDVRDALDQAAELQGRLDGVYEQVAEGTLSAQALAAIEARLLPQIEAAQQRAQRTSAPTVVTDLVGREDAAQVWDRLSMPQRREIVRALATIEILPAGVGRRTFDPATVRVTWKK